jgi:hypothetical protein
MALVFVITCISLLTICYMCLPHEIIFLAAYQIFCNVFLTKLSTAPRLRLLPQIFGPLMVLDIGDLIQSAQVPLECPCNYI